MLNTTDRVHQGSDVQPQLTEGIYLTGDETLLQFVIDYYYRRYASTSARRGSSRTPR